MKNADLGWVAGFLEGEGCFYTSRSPGHLVTRLTASSTDRDVLERLGAFCGGKVTDRPIRRAGKHGSKKDVWEWNLHERNAVELMRLIRPLMSLRRRAKIDEVIYAWERSAGARR